MAGLEQLEIHSKVRHMLECVDEELNGANIVPTGVHCALGKGGRRTYDIVECSATQEINVP